MSTAALRDREAGHAPEPVAFIDLKAQQAAIRDRIEARIKAVLDHGQYINGPEIAELEEALKAYSGAADAVAVASGTDALVIALMAEGVGAGDAVFVPGFTYNATANAVLMTGAEPVFVDVDRRTFNMCPDDLAAKAEAVAAEGRVRPRAVIAVDLFGLPAHYPAISTVAERHGMPVMADAAQSFGGARGNARVGTLAPVTATSFFPAKTLGCYGDGGAIFATDPARGELWRSIRWHGTDDARRDSVRVGMNGRMDSIQAAVLLEKLEIYDGELARRREIAARYDAALADVLDLPARPKDVAPSWGLYSVTVPERDRLRSGLQERGIPAAIYYQTPLHLMPAFADYAPAGGLPACEALAAEILSLPMHPYLSDDQVDRVCEAVREELGA
ncbi:MAG: DegT/DnrJ/EryC1/StrS family aminotransferase [Alphaproteobacteria bacterium]